MSPDYGPLAQTVMWALICIVWRASLQYRRTGSTGIALFRGSTFRELAKDITILFVPACLLFQDGMAIVDPGRTQLPGWIPELNEPRLRVVGVFLMGCATLLIAAAQVQMGKSWRIGIDEGAKPGLVTTGLYDLCRNPIYAFMFMWLAGRIFLVGNWLAVALLAIVYVGVRLQVRQEELYLERTYGDEFRAYAARVGRFVPLVGRLPR